MLSRQLLTAAVLLVLPAAAAAQTFGVAVRGGTLGFGGEAAAQFGEHIAVRGGLGTFPFEYKGEVTEVTYTIKPPSRMTNIGVDLYPGWLDFRVGGGLLFIGSETLFDAQYQGSITVDGQTYTSDEITSVEGALDHGGAAPYAIIGLGRHAGPRLGIFADFGAAFLKEQSVTMTATGPGSNDPQFRQRLENERADLEQEVRDVVKVLPIISLGIRWGF